jgi:hypothetical protein
VLYRVAEVLEGRRGQFTSEVRLATGSSASQAAAEVDAAIDRWVWYAGWADKIAQVRGAANPVAGPYFNFSLPEPAGVVAILAPQESPLLGLVSVIAPAIVSGNTCVVVASERSPLPAVTLGEVLATSDVPGGVVNILTGYVAEIAPWLASHMDVNAIDVTGAPGALADDMAVAAADNLKRVVRLPAADWHAEPGVERMWAYLETKTVWHPMGLLFLAPLAVLQVRNDLGGDALGVAGQVVERREQHEAGAGGDHLADGGHAVGRRPGDGGGLESGHPPPVDHRQPRVDPLPRPPRVIIDRDVDPLGDREPRCVLAVVRRD